jgi:lysophospholipase L1-like esterase
MKHLLIITFSPLLFSIFAHAFLYLMASDLFGQKPTSPLPSTSKTLIIMPMGDSNTAGAGKFAGAQGGWRAPLYALLQNSGYNFDFVGAKTTEGDTCPYLNHWGKGGWQISDVPAAIDGRSYISIQGENRAGLYDEMSDAISTTYFSTDTTTTRNIILLQIGINDILHQVVDRVYGKFNSDKGKDGQGEGQEWVAEGMIARLNALLQQIDRLAASRNLRIWVMLGSLCRPTKEWKGDAVSDVLIEEVKQYDACITKVIPKMVFSNISVKTVDQFVSTNGKLADGVHPNSAGFAAMAQAWYNAITVF